METLAATLWTALVLYLMYKTDAVYSYLSSKPFAWLNFLTKAVEYKTVGQPLGLSYSDYMISQHGNFMVKLLTCRYCLGVWISLVAAFASGNPEYTPAVYFGGQLGCSLFDWMERKLNDE